MTKQRLNIQCYTNNKTGYSQASLNMAIQLEILGVDISLFPLDHCNDPTYINWVTGRTPRHKSPSHHSPCLSINHEHSLYQHISRPYYGFPIFELDNFRPQTIHSLAWTDHLIVCTEWAKSVLVNLGLHEEAISVCPLGVNPQIFKPSLIHQKDTDKYIFMNIGKLSMNKGHHLLPEIFSRAFDQNDNVELWMFAHNPFLSASEQTEWLKRYKNSKLGHKIIFYPEQPTHQDLANYMKFADCGIFPALCEGWNLGLLEMMAVGKPVIATNYSGHTGFCTPENSYLVDIEEVEPAIDNKWFFGEGNWAKITNKEIDQFAEYMRFCYKERPENPEGAKTGEKLTWKNSAETLHNIIFQD